MEDNYPFTGVGNLYRFCQGLTSIDIQNNVLVLFDNDAAGNEMFSKCQNLKIPKNMHICRLPEHEDFCLFETIGPNGRSRENINGTAVAIECFLDLSGNRDAVVRWTSFNRSIGCYQGELADKEPYVKAFKIASLTDSEYDCKRLDYLLDYLFKEWINNSA
jgi:hypothetical protein